MSAGRLLAIWVTAGSALSAAAALFILASAALVGCDTGYGCKVYGEPHQIGTRGLDDPDSCGACGRVCALPGVAVHRCADGRCGVARCGDGYWNVDGRDDTGCECRGPTADHCEPCAADEVLGDALDNDCDLRVDESVDPADEPPYTAAEREGFWPAYTHRPNGELGALDFRGERVITDAPPVTRARCGAGTCEALYPGLDVECVRTEDGTPECRAVFPAAQNDHDPDRDPLAPPPGDATRGYKTVDRCGDGVDQDQNGVVDDGPACRTLVASAASPDCHGRKGVAGCPPAAVALPEGFPGPLRTPGEAVGGVAYVTRDVWMDLTEANEVQFARYLADTAQCGRLGGYDHPLCGLLDDADRHRPAAGLTWCDAYDYCRWAGKRLPTEVEWLRAYGASEVFTRVNKGDLCRGDGAPQHASCGDLGAARIDRVAGEVVRGTAERQTTSTHVFGNLAEWVFDAAVDPCSLEWVACDAEGRPTHAIEVPVDPVAVSDEPDGRRVLRGGGWDSASAVVEEGGRLVAFPGTRAMHYGVRCAESYAPDEPGWVPYNAGAFALAHAECVGASTSRVVPRTEGRFIGFATSACWPTLASMPETADPAAVLGLEGWALAVAERIRPLLLLLDATHVGAPRLTIASGLNAGSEVFWLADYPPSTLDVPGCTWRSCAFEAPGAWVHLFALAGAGLDLELTSGHTLSESERRATCLNGGEDAIAWRLGLEYGRDALDALFAGSRVPADAACELAQCMELVDPDACATECTRWNMQLDVLVERLPSD